MVENIYTEENKFYKDPLFTTLSLAGITPHDQRTVVYKYVSIQTAKIILENCSLRFSSPLIFNDPFEMNPGFIDYGVSREELMNRLKQVLKDKNENLTFKQASRLETKSDQDLIAHYLKAFEIQRQRILLLCMSRTYISTLMWSHYADNHKGVCIGFIIPTIDPELHLFTMNVNYVSEISPLKVLSGNEQERSAALYSWINTKSKVWEYEQEVRCCIPNLLQMETPENLFSDIKISTNTIVEVYFGAGIERKNQLEIMDIIKAKKYPVNKAGNMTISSSTFDLHCTLLNL